MLQSDRTQRKVKHMSHEQTQKSIETLSNYAYASENTNELARISIAAIQVIETLLNDERTCIAAMEIRASSLVFSEA